jgi:hypothetical protein
VRVENEHTEKRRKKEKKEKKKKILSDADKRPKQELLMAFE